MIKKVTITFVLVLFTGLLYAEDKPFEFIYNSLDSKVEYDTQTIEGVVEYKNKVNTLDINKVKLMGNLRTVITLDTPLNKEETVDFLEKYRIKPAQVVIYSVHSSGLLATSAIIDPTKNNILASFGNVLNNGDEFIGAVAIYAFLPIEKIKELKQDKRIFLVDYSGDPRRYSLRSKIVTDRLNEEVQPFIGDRHHVAWPIYTKRLGLDY